MNQSNLLFVFSDQHRQCSLGCYGDTQILTPNFDSFAATGVRFDHCLSNSPVCVPMRGSILTGLHPWNHRALTNDLPIASDRQSIAHWLNESGYDTGYIGKWHLGGIPRDKAIPIDERLGFSGWKVANCNHAYDKGYYFDENNRRHQMNNFSSVVETDLALDFIQSRADSSQPWALFLSWSPPHEPFNAVPQEYLDLYALQSLELRPNVPSDYAEHARSWLHGYYALITLLDSQFGRLLTTLDKLGLADNTLVIYTSDHGDLLGSHGLYNKQLPFEESIAVPLLVRWPGKLTPGTRTQLNSLLDLPATIGALLGLSVPDHLDSTDLSATWFNADAAEQEAVLIHSLVPCHQAADRGDREWIGLRTKRWTYARYVDSTTYVLFDNDSDPMQMINLASNVNYNDMCTELCKKLDQTLSKIGYQFRPWQDMLCQDGYQEAWNYSQGYFQRELLV